jgi:type I restriction enzyme S subunit
LYPNLPTQKRIAAFLDRETARIDELIAKKERLVEVLDTKLRREITKAVTRGINPDAEMQDSGVDWIGQVPTHWSITKLGYLGRCANGINIGGDAFGSGFPFISYGDVYQNRVLPNTGSGLVQSTVSDRASYTVKAGDVFFTRTSETIEEVGFSSVCMETIENAVFAGFLIRFRPSKGKLHTLFSKFAFQHSGLRDYFAKEMNLITRASLSQDLLRNMPVALPPMHEQEVIGQNLEKLETTTRTITDKTRETIEKLKQRRAALITAAVTGQIDVDTYSKAGTTSETLDRIEEEMQA